MAASTDKIIRVSSLIGLLMSVIGLGISIYLTITHYTDTVSLACPETGIVNCAKVTTSSYSEIFSIPLPLLGLLFFVAMIPMQLPYFWRRSERFFRYGRVIFATTGVLFIFWLVYVELFKLNAICLYCTGVHALTILLFAQIAITTSLLSDAGNVQPEQLDKP